MDDARYLYSVVRTRVGEKFGDIGIEDEAVYTIPCRDIAAVVHRCQPKPYETDDRNEAEGWILEHSYVIDQVTKQFGTVLPFAFDIIIRGDDSTVENWLKENYESLDGNLRRVHGKSEYLIQIFCSHENLTARALSADHELEALQTKIDQQPRGKAYLLQRRLDLKLKDLASKEASRLKDQFCSRISPLVDEMKIDGKKTHIPDKYRDLELLACCSCLVCEDNVGRLGEVLDEIQEKEGFAVRFTGPWAPFSFMSLTEVK